MRQPAEPKALPQSTRRRWLGLAGAAAMGLPWLPGCSTTGAWHSHTTTNAPLDAVRSHRLVNRLTWGATEAELARLAQIGPAAYIAAQLSPQGPDDLPAPLPELIAQQRISREPMPDIVRAQQAEGRRLATLTTPEERVAAQRANQAARNALLREAQHRHLWRALYSRHQLREQLTWFWLNHFSVFQGKAGAAQIADFDDQAIRPHVLGHFGTLLAAAVQHPAMLVYLDNQANAANRSNENLAREVLELHTLGVDGGYTQADVQALAQVLTGHGVNYSPDAPRLRPELQALYRRQGGYEFNPARHDASPKRLLGEPVPGTGADQLQAALAQLARHPATARHLSRKLAHFLLGSPAPDDLVARMALAYLRHDGHIARTLAVLVHDPLFTAAQDAGFKDPMRYIVSAVRAGYRPDQVVLNPAPLQGWLQRLGEPLYGRGTPDGWPLDADAWTGSGQLVTRFEIAQALAAGTPALFRPEASPTTPPGLPGAAATPPRPQLALPLFTDAAHPLLAPPTRHALATASPGVQWNTLALASPEFMQR